MGTTEVTGSAINCLCGNQSADFLFSVHKYTVHQCVACGQVYISGISLDSSSSEYDESDYFTERNNYLEKWGELSTHFQGILNKIKTYKSNGAFLDVGCSVGVLLDVARQNGFEVKGVEFSTWASEFARQKGFDVVTGGLIEAAYPEKSFDVIVMNHVLEHIPDPVEIMMELGRILKDDGLLVIGVPNFGSYMAKLMKGKWFSLMPDQHIWQFTRESLGKLLQKGGFVEVYFEAKDNHAIVGWRPIKIVQRLVNKIALLTNNAEAMLVFARKTGNE
ncbi:class I SAM-dependent methyltransferase [Geobacter sp. AOG2]|uniref:class I SAM-dependent methyltransferase n=1 Tax=Geobacter sp. AOG2 TaxID=1566347 RepID=UPI001CC6B104|nr:class I SAM-dependent methyltransferase [Geobacter sp. AOG2]GFE60326.1 SAM-dependent methyltransferase [Geobacter sp. AOG2]